MKSSTGERRRCRPALWRRPPDSASRRRVSVGDRGVRRCSACLLELGQLSELPAGLPEQTTRSSLSTGGSSVLLGGSACVVKADGPDVGKNSDADAPRDGGDGVIANGATAE